MIVKVIVMRFFFGLFFVFIYVFAQTSQTIHTFSVEWVNQYTTNEDFGIEEGFFSSLFNFITGKENLTLVTPYKIVEINDDHFFVLDQGERKPAICSDEGIEFFVHDEFNSFPSLVDACSFIDDKVLFVDSKLEKVFLFDESDEEISTLKLSKDLSQPTGIIFIPENELIYVSETTRHIISIFDVQGKYVKSFGKRGKGNGEFNYPTFLATDHNGFIYVVDALNFRIQIFDRECNFVNSFGEAGDATGYFARPRGIAVDSYGHIYIVDALFHTVQVFNKDGEFLSYFGGQGHHKSSLWMPAGIFINKNNKIFLADSYNSRIQVYSLKNEH